MKHLPFLQGRTNIGIKAAMLCFMMVGIMGFEVQANTYYLTDAGKGNAQTPASWNTNPAGGGTAASNFTTNADIFDIPSTIIGTVNGNWTIGTGVILRINGIITFDKNKNYILTVNGSIELISTNSTQITAGTGGSTGTSFVLANGANLKTANSNGIIGALASSIQLAGAGFTVTLNSGANYEFNGAAQSTTGLPATVNNLTLSGSGVKTAAGAITATTLSAISGVTLNMVTNALVVTNVTNNGTIRTQNTTATPLTASKTWAGTVLFDASAGQTIPLGTYYNLTLSGTGDKGIANNTSVTHILKIVSSGPKASLANGVNATASALTFDDVVQTSGTWGATISAAIHTSDTYFASLSGVLSVYRSGLIDGPGTWTGLVSTDWNTPGNWYDDTKPTSGTTVTITADRPNAPSIVNAVAVCGSILIDISASLTMGATYGLTVAGDWTNNGSLTAGGGTVTFSSATAQTIGGTASTTFYNLIIDGPCTIGTTASCSHDLTINSGKSLEIATGIGLTVGNDFLMKSIGESSTASFINYGTLTMSLGATHFTMQRYMTTGKWHLVSPSVPGGSIQTFLDNGVAKNLTLYAFSHYIEGSNDWAGYYTAGGGNFVSGTGYEVLLTTSAPMSFIGAPVTSASIAITRTGGATGYGWNCIGNPFTSALKIKSLAGGTTFLDTNSGQLDPSFVAVYVWDGTAYLGISNADYSTPYGNLAVNYVQAGQGFFVRSKTDGGSISFDKAMQSHQPDVAFKSTSVSWPGIHLVASTKDAKGSTDVTFNQQMTNGLDVGYDAGLFRSNANFALYTRLIEDNGVDFGLQCLPADMYDRLIIPIGLDCKSGGDVTISAQLVNLPPNCKPVLMDKQTGIVTDLSVEGATYTANVSADNKGVGRFYLYTNQIGSGIALEELMDMLVYSFNKEIHIEGPINNNAMAFLYDMTGKSIDSYRLKPSTLNIINAQHVKDGVYILVIQDGEKRVSRKFELN